MWLLSFLILPSLATEFIPRMCPINYRWEADSDTPKCFSLIDFSSFFLGGHSSYYGIPDPGRLSSVPLVSQSWWRADGICNSIGGELADIDDDHKLSLVMLRVLQPRLDQKLREQQHLDLLRSVADENHKGQMAHMLHEFVNKDAIRIATGLPFEATQLVDKLLVAENLAPAFQEEFQCWVGIRRVPFLVDPSTNEPSLDGQWRHRDGTPVQHEFLTHLPPMTVGSSSVGDCLARSRHEWYVLPCDTPLRCAFCQRPMLTVTDSYDWAEFIVPLFERRVIGSLTEKAQEFGDTLRSLQLLKGRRNQEGNFLSILGHLIQLDLWLSLQDNLEESRAAMLEALDKLDMQLPITLYEFIKHRRRLKSSVPVVELLMPTAADAHTAAAQRAVSWRHFVAMRTANAADLVLSETVDFTDVELSSAADLIRRLVALDTVLPESTMATALLIDDFWNRKQEARATTGILETADRRFVEVSSRDAEILKKHLELQGRKLLDTDFHQAFENIVLNFHAEASDESGELDPQVMRLMAKRKRTFRVWTPPLRRAALVSYVKHRASRSSSFRDDGEKRRRFAGDNFCSWLKPDQSQHYTCGLDEFPSQFVVEPSRQWGTASTDAERWAMILLGAARHATAVDLQKLDSDFLDSNRGLIELNNPVQFVHSEAERVVEAYRLRGMETWEQLVGLLLGTSTGILCCGALMVGMKLWSTRALCQGARAFHERNNFDWKRKKREM